MDDQRKENRERLEQDRKRLLAFSEIEAQKLSIPDRYQRGRYLREIEAEAWLADIIRKLPMATIPVLKRKKHMLATKVEYTHD